MKILAISGSLRAASTNTALLRAAALLAPAGVEIDLYRGLGGLPHFNPDLEDAEPPAVTGLRARVREAGGLLFAVPEYAHGVPGALKNLLDWLVGGEEFIYKPIALFNASPRATHAQASLRETIRTMSGSIVEEASIPVPLLGKAADPRAIAADPELSILIREAVSVFARAIESLPRPDLG
ncbi:MAG TPA: NADPH-dependent FMN reductase [Thermoanaerobaculia bacterium]|nr:NADPH-dependent FMN reductase [Thermoanaerobaculia bacterium]